MHNVSCCSFFPPVWQHPCVGWIVRIQLDSWAIWVDDPGVLQEGRCEASSTTGGLRGVLGFAVCGIGGASRRRHFCWPIVRLRMSASWSSSMTLGRENLQLVVTCRYIVMDGQIVIRSLVGNMEINRLEQGCKWYLEHQTEHMEHDERCRRFRKVRRTLPHQSSSESSGLVWEWLGITFLTKMIGWGKLVDKTKWPRISYPAAIFQTSLHERHNSLSIGWLLGACHLCLNDFHVDLFHYWHSPSFLKLLSKLQQMQHVTGIRQHVLSHPKCREVRQLRWWPRVAWLVVECSRQSESWSHGDQSCHSFHAI